ncbi:MAG: cyclic nucleotide-binding domain-containing protein [Anaerolineales bacterium]|jgi:SulP family sulfate permease|nr:cyclic nucleotide-binding domain-containing protein [Anaerolineales bacterium]
MSDLLPTIGLFQGFDVNQIALLKHLFEDFSCMSGQIIFNQGDVAKYLYLILSGDVAIRYKPYDGPPLTLTRLHAGDVFGWSAVIGSSKYTSSIVSETAVEAIRIQGNHLWTLAGEHPETGKALINRLALIVSPRWENAHKQIQSLLDSNHIR